jgi:hypothetical protein
MPIELTLLCIKIIFHFTSSNFPPKFTIYSSKILDDNIDSIALKCKF